MRSYFIIILVIIILLTITNQNLGFSRLFEKNDILTTGANQVNNVRLRNNVTIDSFIEIKNLQIEFARNATLNDKKLVPEVVNFWIPIVGKNNIENKGYLDNIVSIWSKKEYSNFSYNLKQKTIEGSGQTLILFRANDIDNYYAVNIAAYYNDWFRLEKKVNGKTDTLIQKSIVENSVLPMGIIWDITIIAEGDNIKVTISTKGKDKIKYTYSIEANDSTFSGGRVGMSSIGYQYSHFSDIKLTEFNSGTSNVTISYLIISNSLTNLTLASYITEKHKNPSNTFSYSNIYNFADIGYNNMNISNHSINNSHTLTFPSDLIRPPDIIYFPTEPYQNRTFAIRLIAKGWDEQKQEWVFKEFMSPEFTWEDVVEGRKIKDDGSRQ